MSSRSFVVGASTPCTLGIAFMSAADPAKVIASAANGSAEAVLKSMTPRDGPTNLALVTWALVNLALATINWSGVIRSGRIPCAQLVCSVSHMPSAKAHA